jgi:hypothetical protein
MTGIIVVGVDGSETAMRAAETAQGLAASLGATLHVVTAFDSDRTEVYGSGSDRVDCIRRRGRRESGKGRRRAA